MEERKCGRKGFLKGERLNERCPMSVGELNIRLFSIS